LNKINYNNTTVCGDTRFDRVWEISKNVKHIDFIKEFIQNKKVIIGGSTWKEDEEIIANAKIDFDKYCIIIAPHEIHENHLSEIEKLFEAQKTIRYSKLNATNASKYNVLIIDNIGMLSSLYQYGTFAFIGGGFGKGIHNILEAATFGLPIVFGTNYAKFQEAKELIALGGAFTIHSEIELQKVMTEKLANDNYSKCSIIAQYYVASRVGASKLIFQKIFTSQK
jgi:3-deoxy-D-manno-octulosonic-acid transferase